MRDDALRAAKKSLRAEIQSVLSGLPASRFAAAGELAAERLRQLPVWREALVVCAFLSLPKEIDTEGLCAAAIAAGKTLCLPRTEGGELSFRVCDLAGPWVPGPFGLREPSSDASLADFAGLGGPILVIVPGLAFDAGGGRLGRGKGYYDRFLRSLRALRNDVTAIGLALDEQLVSEVPVDDGDVRLDAVLTESIPG